MFCFGFTDHPVMHEALYRHLGTCKATVVTMIGCMKERAACLTVLLMQLPSNVLGPRWSVLTSDICHLTFSDVFLLLIFVFLLLWA